MMSEPTETSENSDSYTLSTRAVEKLCVGIGSVSLAVAAYALPFPLFYAFAGLGVAYLLSSSCAT